MTVFVEADFLLAFARDDDSRARASDPIGLDHGHCDHRSHPNVVGPWTGD